MNIYRTTHLYRPHHRQPATDLLFMSFGWMTLDDIWTLSRTHNVELGELELYDIGHFS